MLICIYRAFGCHLTIMSCVFCRMPNKSIVLLIPLCILYVFLTWLNGNSTIICGHSHQCWLLVESWTSIYVALQDVIGLHVSSENHGHPLNETLFYITLLVKLLFWTLTYELTDFHLLYNVLQSGPRKLDFFSFEN